MKEFAGLGRLSSKDERDHKYLLKKKASALNRTNRYWTAKPALDQLDTSECVGYSGYQWLTSFPVKNVPPFNPTYLYHQAQRNDEWPGEDYEGSSVRGLFKALKSIGYVNEYRWAFDVETVVSHLLTVGPVVIGTVWTTGMFMADRDGFIDDIGGDVVGGHAYVLIGANRKKLSRNGTGAVRILNSWGTSWEDSGRAWLSFTALKWLLDQDGEACAATEIKKLVA